MLDRQNRLHICVARKVDGPAIGYWIGYIEENPHYKGYPIAYTDIFYIDPEYRKGRTGIRLFQFVEESLRGKGLYKLILNSKLHRDVGPIFERLGFTPIETVYSKYIGD